MYHNNPQETPVQLVFGRDMILNTHLITDWEAINLRNQKIIDKKNQLEDKNCKPHTYRIQEKVSVRIKKNYKDPYIDPYPITQVWTNGNITIRRGAMQERINIIWIKTYNE